MRKQYLSMLPILALRAMITHCLFQELSHFLQSRSGGGETRIVCSGFFEPFCKNVIF
jgi:hypothetical protein